MNVESVIDELKKKYPKKAIVENKDNNGIVIEILCEIDLTNDHVQYSKAIAVADRSMPHYHKEMEETYKIIRGNLDVYMGNEKYTLREGEEITIPPHTVHWVIGKETWFECFSKPGWRFEDHIVIDVLKYVD